MGSGSWLAGDYTNACRKFAASQRSTREVTTSLALANCYKSSVKPRAHGPNTGRPSALRAPKGRLKQSEPRATEHKLSTPSCRTSPSRRCPVRLFEFHGMASNQDDAIWGTPIPVDPGRHVVEATAPGKTPWATAFEIGIGASQTSIDVPVLAPARPSRPADPSRASVSAATQRGAGIGVGVTGLLAATVGTIFALRASSRWDDAKSQCTTLPGACTARGVDLGNEAKERATWPPSRWSSVELRSSGVPCFT